MLISYEDEKEFLKNYQVKLFLKRKEGIKLHVKFPSPLHKGRRILKASLSLIFPVKGNLFPCKKLYLLDKKIHGFLKEYVRENPKMNSVNESS